MLRFSQLVFAFAIACLSLSGVVQAEGYLTSIGKDADRIPVVVVKGTPYEMGKQQGELIKADATEMIHSLMKKIQIAEPERCSNASLDAAWKAIAPHTDARFKEELRGFAEGTGLSLTMLQRAHALPVVMDYSCSSIAAWGSATQDGHLYQTRNLAGRWSWGRRIIPVLRFTSPQKASPT